MLFRSFSFPSPIQGLGFRLSCPVKNPFSSNPESRSAVSTPTSRIDLPGFLPPSRQSKKLKHRERPRSCKQIYAYHILSSMSKYESFIASLSSGTSDFCRAACLSRKAWYCSFVIVRCRASRRELESGPVFSESRSKTWNTCLWGLAEPCQCETTANLPADRGDLLDLVIHILLLIIANHVRSASSVARRTMEILASSRRC